MSDVAVSEDGSLSPKEKETHFRWSKVDENVHVYSDVAGVINRLLHHPEFLETGRTEIQGQVVAIWGQLPLGVLSVSKSPRSSGSHADVVSQAVMRDG